MTSYHVHSTKSLPEPMPFYGQLDVWERISKKYEYKYKNIFYGNCIGEHLLQNGQNIFGCAPNVLTYFTICTEVADNRHIPSWSQKS